MMIRSTLLKATNTFVRRNSATTSIAYTSSSSSSSLSSLSTSSSIPPHSLLSTIITNKGLSSSSSSSSYDISYSSSFNRSFSTVSVSSFISDNNEVLNLDEMKEEEPEVEGWAYTPPYSGLTTREFRSYFFTQFISGQKILEAKYVYLFMITTTIKYKNCGRILHSVAHDADCSTKIFERMTKNNIELSALGMQGVFTMVRNDAVTTEALWNTYSEQILMMPPGHVPDIYRIIVGTYCRAGLEQKAKDMIENYVVPTRSKFAINQSYCALLSMYLRNNDMEQYNTLMARLKKELRGVTLDRSLLVDIVDHADQNKLYGTFVNLASEHPASTYIIADAVIQRCLRERAPLDIITRVLDTIRDTDKKDHLIRIINLLEAVSAENHPYSQDILLDVLDRVPLSTMSATNIVACIKTASVIDRPDLIIKIVNEAVKSEPKDSLLTAFLLRTVFVFCSAQDTTSIVERFNIQPSLFPRQLSTQLVLPISIQSLHSKFNPSLVYIDRMLKDRSSQTKASVTISLAVEIALLKNMPKVAAMYYYKLTKRKCQIPTRCYDSFIAYHTIQKNQPEVDKWTNLKNKDQNQLSSTQDSSINNNNYLWEGYRVKTHKKQQEHIEQRKRYHENRKQWELEEKLLQQQKEKEKEQQQEKENIDTTTTTTTTTSSRT
ncbi:hypothetical protein DFA_11719 [Cavenderia fasciculata]|uniref:Pentacotripeptide-repeat region of PRORP domain-containing protein n=1 Tax=Cavenderia fasciculata TaxID=261658 RepID=F4QE11_CACFS|nr:uncharacterized protein DFA_11719 [Cavenderia fasciculata]EGG13958.1 hypothetical protein DFA_11719 [Cavenderia fasciculata]|eukprot:XP_004350666.1 hypothetical protein DFA_11719 [Cavenderia fasciculata]